MSDAEQTIDEQELDEQPGSPGASAPGDGAPPPAEQPPGAKAPPASGGASSTSQQPDGELPEIEEELDELVKTAAQRDEYLALAQRTQADFENYRKRVAREAAAAQARGVASLARELLPALDNLDR